MKLVSANLRQRHMMRPPTDSSRSTPTSSNIIQPSFAQVLEETTTASELIHDTADPPILPPNSLPLSPVPDKRAPIPSSNPPTLPINDNDMVTTNDNDNNDDDDRLHRRATASLPPPGATTMTNHSSTPTKQPTMYPNRTMLQLATTRRPQLQANSFTTRSTLPSSHPTLSHYLQYLTNDIRSLPRPLPPSPSTTTTAAPPTTMKKTTTATSATTATTKTTLTPATPETTTPMTKTAPPTSAVTRTSPPNDKLLRLLDY